MKKIIFCILSTAIFVLSTCIKPNLKSIISIKFSKDSNFKDCKIENCVLFDDFVYGLIGVIQYTDLNSNCNLAFSFENSFHPLCFDTSKKFEVINNSLEYMGNGIVGLTVKSTDSGKIIDYSIQYSQYKNDSKFKITSNKHL